MRARTSAQYGAVVQSLVSPAEAARRARAAIAYAGLEDKEVAEATHIRPGTLRNILSRTRPSGGTPERLAAIASACKVPASFMEVGFAPLERPMEDVERRVYELERDLDERLAAVERALSLRPVDVELPAPADELLQPPADDHPSHRAGRARSTPPAAGGRRGSAA